MSKRGVCGTAFDDDDEEDFDDGGLLIDFMRATRPKCA